MPSSHFSKKQIQQTLNKVCDKYQLTPEYIMSTSGEFFVMSLTNTHKKKFIIKIRQQRQADSKKRFINEIAILNQLHNQKKLITPKRLISYTRSEPEYLLYDYISGKVLNDYYVSIGKRISNNFLRTNFTDTIMSWQSIKLKKDIHLDTGDFSYLLRAYKLNERILRRNVPHSFLLKAERVLTHYRGLLDYGPFVITHGDLNPKNILLKGCKISVIDWSDVHMNNPFYDFCTLYLFAWNRPAIQKKIKDTILASYSNLDDPDKLFLLNRILLTPRIIKIMEDSIISINQEWTDKKINKNTAYYLSNQAKEAIKKISDDFKIKVDYLYSWLQPFVIIQSVQRLSVPKTAAAFIKKNKKKLYISGPINSFSLENYRLYLGTYSQKLISQYTIKTGRREKHIMVKIRKERGDDLAKQSYEIATFLWNKKTYRSLISRPLYYFPETSAFFYEKLEGMSLANFLINKNDTIDSKLNMYIREIAETLAKIHAITIPAHASIHWLYTYNIERQLNFFGNFIKKTKTNKQLVKKIKKISRESAQTKSTFVHGDFQPENIILHKGIWKIIDFDNAQIGNPYIDVGNFLAQLSYKDIDRDKTKTMRNIFLRSYFRATEHNSTSQDLRMVNFYMLLGHIKSYNYDFREKKIPNLSPHLKIINTLYKLIDKDPRVNFDFLNKFNP